MDPEKLRETFALFFVVDLGMFDVRDGLGYNKIMETGYLLVENIKNHIARDISAKKELSITSSISAIQKMNAPQAKFQTPTI